MRVRVLVEVQLGATDVVQMTRKEAEELLSALIDACGEFNGVSEVAKVTAADLKEFDSPESAPTAIYVPPIEVMSPEEEDGQEEFESRIGAGRSPENYSTPVDSAAVLPEEQKDAFLAFAKEKREKFAGNTQQTQLTLSALCGKFHLSQDSAIGALLAMGVDLSAEDPFGPMPEATKPPADTPSLAQFIKEVWTSTQAADPMTDVYNRVKRKFGLKVPAAEIREILAANGIEIQRPSRPKKAESKPSCPDHLAGEVLAFAIKAWKSYDYSKDQCSLVRKKIKSKYGVEVSADSLRDQLVSAGVEAGRKATYRPPVKAMLGLETTPAPTLPSVPEIKIPADFYKDPAATLSMILDSIDRGWEIAVRQCAPIYREQWKQIAMAFEQRYGHLIEGLTTGTPMRVRDLKAEFVAEFGKLREAA